MADGTDKIVFINKTPTREDSVEISTAHPKSKQHIRLKTIPTKGVEGGATGLLCLHP